MPNKLQVSLIEYRPFADTLGSVDVIIALIFCPWAGYIPSGEYSLDFFCLVEREHALAADVE